MKTANVWEMKNLKIVVPFDAYGAPTEDAAGSGHVIEARRSSSASYDAAAPPPP